MSSSSSSSAKGRRGRKRKAEQKEAEEQSNEEQASLSASAYSSARTSTILDDNEAPAWKKRRLTATNKPNYAELSDHSSDEEYKEGDEEGEEGEEEDEAGDEVEEEESEEEEYQEKGSTKGEQSRKSKTMKAKMTAGEKVDAHQHVIAELEAKLEAGKANEEELLEQSKALRTEGVKEAARFSQVGAELQVHSSMQSSDLPLLFLVLAVSFLQVAHFLSLHHITPLLPFLASH